MSEPNSTPKETAASVMTEAIPMVPPRATAAQTLRYIRRHAKTLETLAYVYVADADRRLVGVISLKVLLAAPGSSRANTLMSENPITVTAADDQEYVAQLALKHQLKAVPVLDREGRLAGAVPSHVILRILQIEYEEDALQAAGVPVEALQATEQRVLWQAWHRLPWLLIGMAGGVVAAVLIERFEAALAQEVLLAAFIPIVVYLADAAGVQVQTIYIRLLARQQQLPTLRYMSREFMTSVVIAAVLGVSTFVLVAVWFDAGALAAIVAMSVMLSVVFAGAAALILPWLFTILHRDPAVASGPMSTIIIDITSIVIYFGLAHLLLNLLV